MAPRGTRGCRGRWRRDGGCKHNSQRSSRRRPRHNLQCLYAECRSVNAFRGVAALLRLRTERLLAFAVSNEAWSADRGVKNCRKRHFACAQSSKELRACWRPTLARSVPQDVAGITG